jgi:uncharacterized membrane protein YdjX (TVP38/TMEM64 family)
MGFDGECDLLVEARPNSREAKAIRAFREGLLAEHLGKTMEEVRAAAKQHSLIGTIEQLAGGARTLQTLNVSIDPEIDQWVPEDVLLDPEQPINSEIFVNHFVPREHQPHTFRRVAIAVAILVTMVALTAAWRWTPLGDYLDLDNLIEQAKAISDNPATPFIAVGVISIAGALAIPLTLLVVVAVLAFGSLKGFVYSYIGAEFSALLTYGIGHAMGSDLVRRFAGRRLNQVSQQLSRHGLLTIITLRIVPVAPYAVINLIAGASHIRIKDFALGTLIGLLPGITAIALFADSVADSIRNPRDTNFAVLAVILAALVGGMLWLRYWLRRKNAEYQAAEAEEQSGNPSQNVASAGACTQEHECPKGEARQE